MKKIAAKILPILIIAATFNIQTASADFSDVFCMHENYDAILHLQENGIIEGYSDGTFKPENKVNRAEFLKIIMEGSQITLNSTENIPFTDVDQLAWYAPYIKKAYTEGWIVGYPNCTFKPEQTISKVEALKILGEVQNWALPQTLQETPYTDTPTSEWYTKYVSYAKTQGYLEENGETFSPADLMTRAKISETIYRTLTVKSTQQPVQQPKEEEITVTPVSQKTIPKNFYEKIVLDEDLPNTFYKNEVYLIKGTVTSEMYEEVNILLDPIDDNDLNYKTFTGQIQNNHFEIPIYFEKVENYNLGILPGNDGQTKISTISVIPTLPETTQEEILTEKATSLSANYKNDQTFIEFSAPQETIKRITFLQNDKNVTYISRQNKDSISINYVDFEHFNEGKVSYYIETAKLKSSIPITISSNFTKSDTKELNAATHTFNQIVEDEISTSPPDRLEKGQQISFSGTVQTDTRTSAFITKPNGFVDEITLSTTSPLGTYFDNPIILSGGNFSISYAPPQEGTYIIEIINSNGLPSLNHPIYTGDKIPLIPDYFDIHEREFYTGNLNLEFQRTELLQKINKSRREHGLSEVIMSEDLNNLAQIHSNDMATNNYFSHINLAGETPEDRRLNMGIQTPVSENIAQDISVTFGHFGLMRSGVHRQNILKEGWTRVGIGIALRDGYLFITEEFSTSQLSEEELENFKYELFGEINQKREENSKNTLTYNTSLESVSKNLNNLVINDNVTLTNSIFQETLESYNVTGTSEAIGRTFNIWSEILKSILEEETSLFEVAWEKIGINIQVDNTGNIHTLLTTNNP